MNDHLLNAALVVVTVLVVLAGLETALAIGIVEDHPNQNWDVEIQKEVCDARHPSDIDRPVEKDPRRHPRYGWTHAPYIVFDRKKTPAQEWEHHAINDEGFRTHPHTGDQGAIVLGDSFTYGVLASNDETYPSLLDQWNPNVSVHNYGIEGYGLQQYYVVYEDKAEEIDHDLVVVGYYLANDRSDAVTYRDILPTRPLFDVSNGELEQIREPTLEGEIEGLDPRMFSMERRNAIVVGLLDGIDDIAAENDAQVLVVTLPRKHEVGGEERYAEQRELLDQYATDEANVHTIHTRPVLTREHKDRRVYGIYDRHTDDYGYYVIARTIQSWLVEHDDETSVEVTADPGDPPDPGVLSRVSARLRYHTDSYGFLTRRGRLLVHRTEKRLGLDSSGANPCE